MMGFALALAALVQLSVDRAMVAEGASSKGLTQADAKKVCGLGAALQDGVRIAKQVAEGAQEKAAHLVAAATAIGHALEALRVEEMGTRAQGPAEKLARELLAAAPATGDALLNATVAAAMCGTELARASGSVMQFVRIAGSLVALQATNAASCLNQGAASLSTNPDAGGKTIDSIIAGVCQGAGDEQVTIEDTQALQKAMETQQSKTHWDISSTSSQYGQKLTDTAADVACPSFTRFVSSVSSGKASTWIGQSASTSDTKKTTRGTFYTLHATTSRRRQRRKNNIRRSIGHRSRAAKRHRKKTIGSRSTRRKTHAGTAGRTTGAGRGKCERSLQGQAAALRRRSTAICSAE
ncbi:hypothetical protein ERJ75_000625000 [Trypanosoma vivax]|nr:hypothetical protein ERJ75_000625000 [Trypanosoma vivax]